MLAKPWKPTVTLLALLGVAAPSSGSIVLYAVKDATPGGVRLEWTGDAPDYEVWDGLSKKDQHQALVATLPASPHAYVPAAAPLVLILVECLGPSCRVFCDAPSDCDDSSVCTTDACGWAGACVFTPVGAGASCDDGIACTLADQCDGAGACTGTPDGSRCADAIACTDDVCTPGVGCQNPPATAGTPCDDAVACTTSDRCDGSGGCLGTPDPSLCADGLPCTDDVCGSTGCTHPPLGSGTPCDDAVACTTGDRCDGSGGCLGTPDPSLCADGRPCTDDVCTATGCANPPLGVSTPCDDAIACTLTDRCDGAGACAGTPDPSLCADPNPCTADLCTPGVGCEHTPIGAGLPCDDGTACTSLDRCDTAGVCAGTPNPALCSDGLPCTDDVCTAGTGCSNPPSPPGTPCDDGIDCTVDLCDVAMACISTPDDRLCDDASPATVDLCEPATGGCRFPAITLTELAGNPLTSYPFFEYVRAFNVNAGVQVAIDPGRFPAIAGRTCDVAFVLGKTAAEWDADRTLADVTSGGSQPAAFVAGTIQANTFAVTAPSELSADAGTGLGVPYDVVLDCDRDGKLSGGDFIDGVGDEGGFYDVHDLVQPGPLATSSCNDTPPGTFNDQRVYWPTGIATMGQLPLVVISHGNGHDYRWYDFLQEHLASYGYVVMSHQNETGPGIETASSTTLNNTDRILRDQGTMCGGAFGGHIDGKKIVWIGHSRGGEGVARAYDRMRDEGFTPANYTRDDILLISSIAPTDFLGADRSNPHEKPYHLLYGSGDGDVWGCADNDIADSFNIYERATDVRQSTYVHGADHNDFNCCGANDWDWCGCNPPGTEMGRPAAQEIQKAAYLALVKRYVDGNVPAKDFLWRQMERFRAIGITSPLPVDLEFREGAAGRGFVVDDFQANPATGTSSSGGAVTFDVANLAEGVMNDADGVFDDNPGDPMNGMTRGRFGPVLDDTRGVVFDYDAAGDRFLEFAVGAAGADFSDDVWLSLRACQGTRHPRTAAELADLTFSVTLIDGSGGRSTIGAGAFGGGIEEPYQRTTCGFVGVGWQNEFESVRIRLTDFLNNGSGLDLTDITAVRLDFGATFGSSQGRLGLDDLEVTKD